MSLLSWGSGVCGKEFHTVVTRKAFRQDVQRVLDICGVTGDLSEAEWSVKIYYTERLWFKERPQFPV